MRAYTSKVVVSTTTSIRDSGLLGVLIPLFAKQSDYSVSTVPVGSGLALALAAGGDADVALTHMPTLEEQFVAEGKLHNRRMVMFNEFVIVGPKKDPAKIRSTKSAADALKAIEQSGAIFISRGDNSGTHAMEKSLWKCAGIEPKRAWYTETRQGMGATLEIANDRNAYTITDRGTYLALRKWIRLPILVEGDKALLNIYSVMEADPANDLRINRTGGKALADFMVAPRTQDLIRSFGKDQFGQSLFITGELALPLRPKLPTDQSKIVCPNQCPAGYFENHRPLSATEYDRLSDIARTEIGKNSGGSTFYCMYCDCVWIECTSGKSQPLGRLKAGYRWQSR